MIKSDKIKDIFLQNKDDIAFIIGNGIHYQYKDCSITWNELLESLWLKYTGENKSVPDGITTTEFYDIIELCLYSKNLIIPNCKEDVHPECTLRDLKNIDRDELSNYLLKSIKNEINAGLSKYDNKDEYNNKYQHFISSCRRFCEQNFEEEKNLSNEECVNLMISTLSNGTKRQILNGSIKKTVADKFEEKKTYNLYKCIASLQKLNTPILTTNFDTYISDSIGAKRFILKPKEGKYKFTDFYPWNMYYCDKEIQNPLEKFAVWHINGTKEYSRSIRLGLSDYMGSVERARKMVQGNNLNEYFTGKNQSYWAGYNTWLHIMFNKSLFIFGLGLEENEVFLRWLLIQRAKYSRMYNRPLHGWYVGKDIKPGKKFFLEQLGFEVLKISDYNILYQTLETL